MAYSPEFRRRLELAKAAITEGRIHQAEEELDMMDATQHSEPTMLAEPEALPDADEQTKPNQGA